MPDFSPDYTFRYKTRYLAGGITHDFTVRGGVVYAGGEALAGDLSLAVGQFFAAIETVLMEDFAFLNASWAYADSNIFTPTDAVPPNPEGAVAIAGQGARRRATACAMSGRSSGGGTGRLYFFGLVANDTAPGDAGSDGKILASELAGITTAKGIADSAFHSSNGSIMDFYPVFTIKVNDHALRLARRIGT